MSRSLKVSALFGTAIISLWLSGCGPASTTSNSHDANEEHDAAESHAPDGDQNVSTVRVGLSTEMPQNQSDDRLARAARGNRQHRQGGDENPDRPRDRHGGRERGNGTHLRGMRDSDQDDNDTQSPRNRGSRQGSQDENVGRHSQPNQRGGRQERNASINETDANHGGRRRDGVRGSTPAPIQWVIAQTVEQQTVLSAAREISRIFSGADNRAAILADIVRLSFHDAATFDPITNTGGADGCVDLSAAENNGLSPIIEVLNVVQSVTNMSRADVWTLAGSMAIEASGGPKIEFQTGRIDSNSCGGHGERLPNAELGHSHILDVMVTKLNFSERETAALMGAHVLGQATRSISGYEGSWVRNNARFSNQYFQDLIERPWDRETQPPFQGQSRNQWDGRDGTMMLSTDIELAFNTSNGCTRAGGGGGGQVRDRRCPRAVSAFSDAVTEFAQRRGEQAFFQTFGVAFKKLLSLGSVALTCPFADCHTPGSS